MDGRQVSVEECLGLVHKNIVPKLGCEETPWVCTEEAWFNRLLRPTPVEKGRVMFPSADSGLGRVPKILLGRTDKSAPLHFN